MEMTFSADIGIIPAVLVGLVILIMAIRSDRCS